MIEVKNLVGIWFLFNWESIEYHFFYKLIWPLKLRSASARKIIRGVQCLMEVSIYPRLMWTHIMVMFTEKKKKAVSGASQSVCPLHWERKSRQEPCKYQEYLHNGFVLQALNWKINEIRCSHRVPDLLKQLRFLININLYC